MKQADNKPTQLRLEAENKLARKRLALVQPHPDEELLHELIHELSVHKIELEMQNEQMRQAQLELEKSRDRYVEYFDFAPVGYLTLNHEAMIDEVNLTGAALLGVERSKLLHSRFAPFVAVGDTERWQHHFINVLNDASKLSCELELQNSDGVHFHALLNCLRLKKDGQETVVRIVLSDITELKQLQASLQKTQQ